MDRADWDRERGIRRRKDGECGGDAVLPRWRDGVVPVLPTRNSIASNTGMVTGFRSTRAVSIGQDQAGSLFEIAIDHRCAYRNSIASNSGDGGDGDASLRDVRSSAGPRAVLLLSSRSRSIVVVAIVGGAPRQLRSPTGFNCLGAGRFERRLGQMEEVGPLVRLPVIRTGDAARRPAGSPRRGRHSARRPGGGSARPCSTINVCGTVRSTCNRRA